MVDDRQSQKAQKIMAQAAVGALDRLLVPECFLCTRAVSQDRYRMIDSWLDRDYQNNKMIANSKGALPAEIHGEAKKGFPSCKRM
jgi:hypothetical protein